MTTERRTTTSSIGSQPAHTERTVRRALLLVCLGAAALTALACGGDDTTGSPSGGGSSGSAGSDGLSGGNGGSSSGTAGSAMSTGGAGGMAGTTGGSAGATGGGGATTDGGGAGASGDGAAACNTNPGMALEFQGMTPDLVQATIAKLPMGKASRTVEMWAYFDGSNRSWVNEHGLFEYGARAGDATYTTQGCHEFALNSTAWPDGQAIGMLHPYGNCNSVDNFFNLPAGTPKMGWLHISFGYDSVANQFQFTINGSKMLDIGTGQGAAGRTHPEGTWPAESGWNSTKSALSIGTTVEFAGPTGWQGKIDELRVWSVFRTEAEIKANMRVMLKGNETGLVAYYKFDEGMGTNAADTTGDATNVAKMVSDTKPKWVTSDIPGTFSCPQ